MKLRCTEEFWPHKQSLEHRANFYLTTWHLGSTETVVSLKLKKRGCVFNSLFLSVWMRPDWLLTSLIVVNVNAGYYWKCRWIEDWTTWIVSELSLTHPSHRLIFRQRTTNKEVKWIECHAFISLTSFVQTEIKGHWKVYICYVCACVCCVTQFLKLLSQHYMGHTPCWFRIFLYEEQN